MMIAYQFLIEGKNRKGKSLRIVRIPEFRFERSVSLPKIRGSNPNGSGQSKSPTVYQSRRYNISIGTYKTGHLGNNISSGHQKVQEDWQ